MVNQSTHKPPVFVQIDLDGLWAIRRCYGFPEQDGFVNDPVYSEGLVQILDLFRSYNITGTFFVTGRDLELPEKTALLKKVVDSGHEIGNHSYNHIIGLSTLPQDKTRTEIIRTQEIIEEKLHYKPVGFRSPGYDINVEMWRVLENSGFLYDASLFSTPWVKVLKTIVNFLIRKGRGKNRQFGSPLKKSPPRIPFRLKEIHPNEPDNLARLWEIPVSVSPRLKLPIQVSYAQLLGARHFIKSADYYRRHHLPLSCIFHGIDLVDTTSIEVLPGAGFTSRLFFCISWQRKLKIVKEILNYLSQNFKPITILQWISEQNNLAVKPLSKSKEV